MKDKMIKIVTFHNAHNFGAVLQCYALKTAIKNLDRKCEVENVVNQKINDMYKPQIGLKKKSLAGLAKSIIAYPTRKKGYDVFEDFISKRILDKSADWDCKDADTIYISGSDQVWNWEMTDFDKTYFLDFVKMPESKNAYSASFGFDEIPAEYQDEYKRLLGDFNKISVREQQGADILKKLLGREVPVTLDPSMLLTEDNWRQFAETERKRKKEYILLYLMSETKSLIEFTRKLKKATGLDVIYINNSLWNRKRGFKYKSYISPEEWVRLFLNARYVVTNSFHGTAFSINFNKDFFAGLLPSTSKVNSRIENILKKFGLEDRLVSNVLDADLKKAIDYEKVNNIIKTERKKSLEFLESVVK
ncbi:MAG: polysaccharide pyruvyl transferase family protein [Clostridia bacterium]|nr:polysaccharide pyruvyl transferase family protein [Clostridia bacterium]